MIKWDGPKVDTNPVREHTPVDDYDRGYGYKYRNCHGEVVSTKPANGKTLPVDEA
jgi:hypothetical protein